MFSSESEFENVNWNWLFCNKMWIRN